MQQDEQLTRRECIDQIAEVLAHVKQKRGGKRAEQALAAAALYISGSLLWHDKRKQEEMLQKLDDRWIVRRDEIARMIGESVNKGREG